MDVVICWGFKAVTSPYGCGAPQGLKDGHHRGLKGLQGCGSKDPSDHLNESM
jgi:hypothetical protein